MLITRLLFVAIAALLLGFAVWRETHLLRGTMVERHYWGAFSQLVIFLSFDFLAVVFLSYLLAALIPILGVLSQPVYVRLGLSAFLVGVTAAGLGEAVAEAKRAFTERRHLRMGISVALGGAGLICVVIVYLKFLRG